MKSVLIVLLLCLASALCFSQEKRDAEYYYNLGVKIAADSLLEKKGGSPYREAFPYFFKASELANEGSDLQLKALYQIAYMYNYAKTDEKSIVIKRAITGLKHVRNLNRRDEFAAKYFFRAGLAFIRDYRPDSAIFVLIEAKKIYESLKGDYTLKISDCYHAIADVYKDVLYDFNTAERFYEKALAINEKAGDSELNLIMVLKLHYELAAVNRAQHDYEKALVYILRGLDLTKKFTSHRYQAFYQESVYINAADIYSDMKDYDKAEEFYHKAISLCQKFNTDHKEDLLLAKYYFGLAEVLQKSDKISASAGYYQKAILIFSSTPGPKDAAYIKSYHGLGKLYLSSHHMDLSLYNFRKSISLLNDFSLLKSGQAAEIYRSLGRYYEKNQQADSALVYYQYALIASSNNFRSLYFVENPIREDILLDGFAYETLLAKSTLLSKQYLKNRDVVIANAALKSFSLAEKILIDSRARLDMDNAKWDFFDSNFGLYEQALILIDELSKKNSADTLSSLAFYYMENSKSKMLTDELNEAEFARPLITSDSLVMFLDLQRRNLYKLQDDLRKNEKDSSAFRTIRNSIVEIDRSIVKTETEIEKKYPAYIKTKYRYSTPQLEMLKAFSKQQKCVMVEYFWGNDYVFGLAISDKKTVFKRLGTTSSILLNLKSIGDFLRSDQFSFNEEEVKSFEKYAYQAYQQLVLPFDAITKQSDRLIVLPDGPIEQIPFEVMVSKPPSNNSHKNFASLSYLLKDYSISYSFSSSFLLNRKKEDSSDPLMLAFGFTESGIRQGEQKRSSTYGELPGSELELKTIIGEFPFGQYYYGKQVTEERFKSESPNFDLIHLAVHGAGDTEQTYSASLFFRDTLSSKEDGRLHWYELFGIQLKAKLAVISSCESGIGKAYRGEGMLSMASAFAFAGCKNIVMGLWDVDDRVSSDLMGEFYKNIRKGDKVDIALTNAKRMYLEKGDDLTANPRLWAPLVSYGNESIIQDSQHLVTYVSIIVLIISFVAFLFLHVYKRKRPTLK